MVESLLIKAVKIMTPSGIREGDVFVKNGKISALDWHLDVPAQQVINEPGLMLMPGVLDPHVHFREPGAEWKETLYSGSKAAVSGGVTGFFDMPNTKPSATTYESIAEKKRIASETSLANYNFYVGATTENLDVCNSIENVAGIKLFVGSSTGELLMQDERDIERLFANGKRLIAVHSELEQIIREKKLLYSGSEEIRDHIKMRPPEAALLSTQMLVRLAKKYRRRLHICHLTTQEEAEFLATEKDPEFISTEVSPQHAILAAPGVYTLFGNYAKINPPIRESRHRNALWLALKSGVIDCVGTDHAPHTIEEKEQPFSKAPAGMPGVETSLPLFLNLMNQGKCTLEEVVMWLCERPAKLFGVQGKGRIQIGYDGDLVLVDLKAKRTIDNKMLNSKAGWSVFNGKMIEGWPVATFVNGQLVWREGDFFEGVKGQEIKVKPSWERGVT